MYIRQSLVKQRQILYSIRLLSDVFFSFSSPLAIKASVFILIGHKGNLLCASLSYFPLNFFTDVNSLANICIQANIRLQIFAYQRIFVVYCFKFFRKAFHKSQALINIRFFLKIFAQKGIFASVFIRFACKIRRFASMPNKLIKPVNIMINNLFKTSQVSTTRYLLMTVSHTIMVSYDNTPNFVFHKWQLCFSADLHSPFQFAKLASKMCLF